MEQDQLNHFSRRVLQDMNEAVLVADLKGNIVYTNQPASKMLEIEAGLLKDRYNYFTDNNYNDAFFEAILDAIYHKESTTVKKVPFMALSGRKYVFRLASSYLHGEKENDSLLIVTLNDETETEQMRQKLQDSSKTFTTFLFGFCIWFILRYTSLSWHDLGVMTDRPKETILTALIVAACAVAFLFLLKTVARLIDPTSFEPDAPFFDISRFGMRQTVHEVLFCFTRTDRCGKI